MIKIPLTKGYYALIDDIDADLAAFKWRVVIRRNGKVYAVRSYKSCSTGRVVLVYLHRAVMAAKPGVIIVNINGNGLDNRRINLKCAIWSDERRNISLARADSKSGERGVYPAGRRWLVQIRINGRTKHVGRFETFEAARVARLEAERMYLAE